MAEVIGDDLNAFIKTAKEKGSVPAEYDVPFAHTPAFVGSHVTGYDNALKGIVEHFWDGKAGTVPKLERQPNNKINFIGGFDGYTVGNTREIKRIFELMGIEYTILADNSDVFDTPTDGEFRMYDGGTTLEDAANAINAKATVSMQHYCTEKTLPFIAGHGQEVASFHHPIGVTATDDFIMTLSRIPAPTSTARNSQSMAIRISASGWRRSCSNLAPSPPMCSPPTAPSIGPKRSRPCSTVRRSARTATSIPARISGICARCCSPILWIS
jgi:nitrogenase molybdenum-iron protein alpha/beta subunit